MKNKKIDYIKEIVEVLAKDFRVLHQKPKLSFLEDTKTIQTIDIPKSIIMLLADFQGNDEDKNIAKKTLTQNLCENLGIEISIDEINKLYDK